MTPADAMTRAQVLLLLVALWLLVACSPPVASERAAAGGGVAADPPAAPGALAPNLAPGRSGPMLTWLEPVSGGAHRLQIAELRSSGWGEARTLLRADDLFANWADLPAAVEGATGERLVHVLRRMGKGTYDYGIELLHAPDGARFEPRGWLHDSAIPGEHGFVSYVALEEEGIQAFWLDSRAMGGGEGEGGAMQLRTTRVRQGAPEPSTLLDERVCECCQTGAALAASGPVVAYRDRSRDEVRDIAVVRRTGEGWSRPLTIGSDGWRIEGCPVNGPAVAAREDRVAVAWFTAAQDRPRVLLALSSDGGVSFGQALEVDGERPLGRVGLLLDPRGRAWVSWIGSTGGKAQVRLRPFGPEGEPGELIDVAPTTAERAAGFPRIVRHGDRILVVWVEQGEVARLRAADLPLA